MTTKTWTRSAIAAAWMLGGCAKDGDAGDADTGEPMTTADTTPMQGTATDTGEGPGPSTADPGSSGSTNGEQTSSSGAVPPVFFDVGTVPDNGGGFCGAPLPVTCDDMDDDPWHAFGLNCPGGPQVDGTITLTGPEQIHVHEGELGTYAPPPFPPREGDKFVILSSGIAQELTIPGMFAAASIDFAETPLPPPILTNAVSATEDCVDDPGLVGTGDCSNTIQAQWDQGSGAHDYAEMRIATTVPVGTFGLSYDFAMFSTEYPDYYQSTFNDMYIAWLESELWTGNISFDDMGHPISLNAGFLDYKDAPNDFDCPAPCTAPELQGTAMEGHAGTRWLTTTAGVTPGESIELVLGVFDLSDSVLDTVVILDNFHWACEGGGPVTIPG